MNQLESIKLSKCILFTNTFEIIVNLAKCSVEETINFIDNNLISTIIFCDYNLEYKDKIDEIQERLTELDCFNYILITNTNKYKVDTTIFLY